MKLDAADFPNEVIDALAERIADRLAAHLAPPTANDAVLDTQQAANYLNLSRQQLEIWRCRGGGPAFSKLERRVRYKRSQLDAWLAERQRGSTSQ